MVSSVFMAVAPLGVRHREPTPAGALSSPRKRAPANRSRSPALISGQAVATGERIARAAAMMRWQLTCMAITVAGRVELLNCISAGIPRPGSGVSGKSGGNGGPAWPGGLRPGSAPGTRSVDARTRLANHDWTVDSHVVSAHTLR